MKLAFIASANSIHGIRWIKFFADEGHEIVWIALAPPNTEAQNLLAAHPRTISFHELSPSPLEDVSGNLAILYLPFAVWRAKRILKKVKPDVLHVHSAGTYGLIGALTGFHPLILTPWGSDILLNSGFKKKLVAYVVKNADYFTCDGENTRTKLIELGANSQKIEMIRFGVDVKKFFPYKKESNGHHRPIKIISLRMLISVYDIETLIKAVALVVRVTPNVNFLIFGDGDQKPELQKLTKELQIDSFIEFKGRYSPDKLPQMLHDADIYVSTALSDSGLSASTAEAMAAGLPVVVSDSGDNRDWVTENKGGFVFPCKNEKILAEKLIYLIKNQVARESFGAHNRLIIEEKNNYYQEMAKTEEIYRQLGNYDHN